MANPDINPEVDIPPIFEDLAPDVDEALNLISSSIADIKSIGVTDADLERFLFVSMNIPFDDAGKKLAATFTPEKEDIPEEDQEMTPGIQNVADQITAGLSNPFAPVLHNNQSPFGDDKMLSSNTQLGPGTFDFVKSVFDKAKLTMRSMFISGSDNESNMAGLFMLALEELEPQIDYEVDNLKEMKRLVYQIIEMASKLPQQFVPEIPNMAIIQRLCDAERNLGQVQYELTNHQTFDQARFNDASNSVCAAKNILKTGLIPDDLKLKIAGIFQMNDLQVSAILSKRLSPDPMFKHALIRLQQLNNFVQETDPRILEVHNNILDITTIISNVQDVGIGNILLLIIDSIKRQISAVRTNLEQQTLAIMASGGEHVPKRLVVDGQLALDLQGHSAIRTPPVRVGFGVTVSSQELTYNYTVIYAQLSALCFILQRAQKLYQNVQGLLNGESKIMKAVADFAYQYTHNQERCVSNGGAQAINTAVVHFINAAECRLGGGKESNEVIAKAGQDLIKRINAHIRFLKCIRGSQSLGHQGLNNQLSHALGGPSNAYQAKNAIFGLARSVPEMAGTLKQLDLRKILGIERTEYNGLDKLMKGLGILIQLCPERVTRDIAREFQDRFNVELARRKASAVTMGGFEEVPQIALKIAIKQRVDGVKKIVDQLQKFVNIDIAALCAKGGEALPTLEGSIRAAGVFTSAVGETQTTRSEQIADQDQAGKDAADQTTPYKTGGLST